MTDATSQETLPSRGAAVPGAEPRPAGVSAMLAATSAPGPEPVPGGAGRRGLYRGGAKRALDLLAVAVLAPPVLALLLPLLLLVACDGHSPIYVQRRLGRDGRVFRMLKLRTMVPDADRRLDQALAADPGLRAEWDHRQKLPRDPRVTRIGAILRRTSLDELPQLANVALGQMSLVGPRPMLPGQRGLYPGDEYFRMRPGITGLWQVSARNESSFAERAAFDRAYFETLSLRTDLRILARTLRVVVRGTGM